MSGSDDTLGASIQRTVLGVLLAVLALVGLGLMRALADGRLLAGTAGIALVALSVTAIWYLFREGVREGAR